MRRRSRAAVGVVGLVLALTAGMLAGCSSANDYGCADNVSCESDDPEDQPGFAAVGVCLVLVEFDDTVATEINAASRQITLDTDPDVARELLLNATENIQDAVDALPEHYEAVRVSDDGDLGQLVDDASANTAALDEQLDMITTKLTDGLDGADARGILSATFIDMEKIQSLAQPDQGDYNDASLVAALDTEPACEHTISR